MMYTIASASEAAGSAAVVVQDGGMLLHEVIANAAAVTPAAPALVWGDRTWSFAELDAAIVAAAARIAAVASPGERIAVVSDNHPDVVIAMYAAPAVGVIVMFGNTRLTPHELGALIDDVNPVAVFASPDHLDRLAPALGDRRVTELATLTAEPAAPATRPARPAPAARTAPAADPDDTAWIIHTSGTTGLPKGACLTHRSLLAAVLNTAMARPLADDDVYLFPFPLFHVAAYNVVVGAIRTILTPQPGLTCNNVDLGSGNFVPLFTMNNILVDYWEPKEDEQHEMRKYEVGFYTKFDGYEPLEQFDNPVTGERVPIHHFRLGPVPRVYTPEGLQGARPCVYAIHGGGYVMGRAKQDDRLCGRLAARLGVTVVSVDYRLAPEHPFPTPLEDCFAAYEFVHREAASLGVDPARLVIAGQSAGGGLAAALTLLVHDRQRPAPRLQLLLYPMLDDRTATREHDGTHHRLWDAESNRYGWASYLARTAGSDGISDHAAPARRRDLGGLPPAWIGVGTCDLFHDENLAYAAQLRAAGVPTTLEVVDGAFHAFDAVLPKAKVSQRFFESQVAAI